MVGVDWTAPEPTRVDEPFVGSERMMLQGFLDYARATLLVKCAGLTAGHHPHPPTRAATTPSTAGCGSLAQPRASRPTGPATEPNCRTASRRLTQHHPVPSTGAGAQPNTTLHALRAVAKAAASFARRGQPN